VKTAAPVDLPLVCYARRRSRPPFINTVPILFDPRLRRQLARHGPPSPLFTRICNLPPRS